MVYNQSCLLHDHENTEIDVRYGSHLGKVFNFAGKKTTENLKPQPESKLLVSTIRVALGEKNVSDDTLINQTHVYRRAMGREQ